MLFDFDKFEEIAAGVYPHSFFTFEEAMGIFRYYFERYERHTGRVHPPIKAHQIKHICEIMPFIDEKTIGVQCSDVVPESYPAMIDQHFATKYRNCDYRVCHFFSGRIRELRFYETVY